MNDIENRNDIMWESKAVIGVPITRNGSYILDTFIKNQENIKNKSKIGTYLVFATEDKDFAYELDRILSRTRLEYNILNFQVQKPDWAKDRIWAITQAREEIRKFSIDSEAGFLIFLDCDMTYG